MLSRKRGEQTNQKLQVIKETTPKLKYLLVENKLFSSYYIQLVDGLG